MNGASGIGFGLGLSIGKAGSQKAKTQVKPYIEPDVLESIYRVWEVSDAQYNVFNRFYDIYDKKGSRDLLYAKGYNLLNGIFESKGEGTEVYLFSGDLVIKSEELTVISMVKSSSIDNQDMTFNRISSKGTNASINKISASNSDKYYILGYSIDRISEVGNGRNVTEILGDKNDPSFSHDNSFLKVFSNFEPIYRGSNSVWYWTFIATKALTDDQIHQVIRYFNLDKYVEPQIYYNIEKQGLSNENHAEFNDKLIDYSGNGYDLQLYNFSWDWTSGTDDPPQGYIRFDGTDDYGKVVNLPSLEDYTVFAYIKRYIDVYTPCVASKGVTTDYGAFRFEEINSSITTTYSFGKPNNINTDPSISSPYPVFQNKHKYGKWSGYRQDILSGDFVDNNSMWIAKINDHNDNYSAIDLYDFMLFPYSLSDFLLNRQLERLGSKTLYDGLQEFRSEVKTNVSYEDIKFYWSYGPKKQEIKQGEYVPNIGIFIASIKPVGVDEVSLVIANGKEYTTTVDADGYYNARLFERDMPLKIDITIDEYIRFEDIVQPYPLFLRFQGENGEFASWGSKLKVGEWNRVLTFNTILNNLYYYPSMSSLMLNGEPTINAAGYPGFIVQKEMVFTLDVQWKLDSTPPKCILSPTALRMTPESLEYLGYIPDMSGNGNHAYFHNIDIQQQLNDNGSLHLDGVDDYIDFPTLRGGKQVFMKCKFNAWGGKYMLYDQRDSNNTNKFGIFINSDNPIAYYSKNSGNTYIDGVLNKYVESIDLYNIVHNIVATNTLESPNNETTTPVIGSYYAHDDYFTNMDLYSFMLFDEISSDEDIFKLNEAIGIEGKYVETPPYYYDTFGKSNSDADKAVITNKGGAVGDYDLNVMNVAYEGESGYTFFSWEDWVLDSQHAEIAENGSLYIKGLDAPYSIATYKKGHKGPYAISKMKFRITAPYSGGPSGLGSFSINVMSENGEPTGRYILQVLEPKDPTSVEPIYYSEQTYIYSGEYLEITANGFYGEDYLIIEVLPYGLNLDGVDDYITNDIIPEFTDYTYIFKRDLLNVQTMTASMKKGYKKTNDDGAFYTDLTGQFGSFGNAIALYDMTKFGTIYGTKDTVNGISIKPGEKTDVPGITIGQFDYSQQILFYKLMLYPVTIDMLSINMLKNMFEFDGEINMRSPIFKPYKEYSSKVDFSEFKLNENITATLSPTTINITHINGLGPTFMIMEQPKTFLFKPFKVNIEGLTDDLSFYYLYSYPNMGYKDIYLESGINEIVADPEGLPPLGFGITCYEENYDCNITITLINE